MGKRWCWAVMLGLMGGGVWGGEDAGLVEAPAWAEPFQKVDPHAMERFRRDLTLRLVARLRDPDLRRLFASRLEPGVRRLSLNRLVEDYAELWPSRDHRAFCARLQDLDLDLRRSKGVEAFSQGLLGLEVIWPKDGPHRVDWATVLFGVGPQGPKRTVNQVEAYDSLGRLHLLDAKVQPGVLVLMPGTDRAEAKRAGLALVNAGLRAARLCPPEPPAPPAEPVYCAKLTYIRLEDDQEPWWKGAAEVYAFVAGVDPTVDKPSIKLINLPYLAYDHTDYFPNQLIIFWRDWRFNAADVQLWESDDNTNYQDILEAVLAAVSAAMAVGGAPEFAWIPALAKAIIDAMPSAWFKDNDDYLDTFYTLERGRAYERLAGAGNNATISLVPYQLLP